MRTLSTFDWLLIGHLVGDWLLQNNWMATGKKQGPHTLAGIVHFSLYTTAVSGALWLSGLRDVDPAFYVGVGAILFISHWLIDAAQLAERWMRLFRQSDLEWVRILVDQTLHLLILALLLTL